MWVEFVDEKGEEKVYGGCDVIQGDPRCLFCNGRIVIMIDKTKNLVSISQKCL